MRGEMGMDEGDGAGGHGHELFDEGAVDGGGFEIFMRSDGIPI